MAFPADPLVVQFGGQGASRSQVNHSYHGMFWPTGVNLPAFSWEFWACRGAGTSEYLISEGYGGAHSVLFDGVQGNIYDGVVSTTPFTSNYTPQAGEWFHSRVGWDGQYLYTWVNGICVGIITFVGPRRAQLGQLYVAGSDHSNFFGKLAAVRGYEGVCPTFGNGGHFRAWRPARAFAAVNPSDVASGESAQFVASYQGGSGMFVPDYGIGWRGDRHPGVLEPAVLDQEGPAWVADATAPFQAVEPARVRTFATPGSVPGSAKIFDSCGRADSIPAFLNTALIGGFWQTDPGSTEGGSLGVKAWQHIDTNQRWGVFDGALAPMVDISAAGGIYVNNDSADMDVRVTRKNANGWNAQMGAGASGNRGDVMLLLRYTDINNHLYTSVYRDTFGTNGMNLNAVVAGVDTQIKSWTLPNYTWSTMRWVLSGTSITLYIDGTQVGTAATTSANLTALGVGLKNWGGSQIKATNFTVL